MFSRITCSLHHGNVTSCLKRGNRQRFAGEQVIGEVAMEGIEWSLWKREVLLMNCATAVARMHKNFWQCFRWCKFLFNQIAGPAACFNRLLSPLSDNRP